MDVGFAIFIGFFIIFASVTMSQFAEGVREVPIRGIRKAMFRSRSENRPINKKVLLPAVAVAVLWWAIAIPVIASR